MQEDNFLLCLRNPCENKFSKLQIFVFLRGNSKRCSGIGRMHENIVSGYICIFVTLHRKPGNLNTRFVFYNIKIQKNPQNKYITRFFF
jgi:hypothetical protein